jgi:hypothetical protein
MGRMSVSSRISRNTARSWRLIPAGSAGSDPRATRLAVLLLLAGTIGILSQAIYVGGKEVAIAPYYCDCEFLSEQMISRVTVLEVIGGIQSWMIDAFTFLLALGLLALASLASAAAWPSLFVRASQLLAAVGLTSVAWSRIATPLLINVGWTSTTLASAS